MRRKGRIRGGLANFPPVVTDLHGSGLGAAHNVFAIPISSGATEELDLQDGTSFFLARIGDL